MKLVGSCRYSLKRLASLPSKTSKDLVLIDLIKEANKVGLSGRRIDSIDRYIDYETDEMVYLFKGQDNEPA